MFSHFKGLFPVLFIIGGFGFILSCNSSGSPQKLKQKNTLSAYDSSQGRSFIYTKYELPLSIDVYRFLKSKKNGFNLMYMHNLNVQDKYFTDIKRAFALGIYSSDLAYASIYEQSQDAVDYFSASIELAHKLNIENGYNSKTLDRAYENIDNEDSLAYIAGESYWLTCSSLEKNKRDNILPLVVIGSWIESMHILTKACLGSPPESGMFEELYVQLKYIEKLLTYTNDALNTMEASESKNEITKIVESLNSIQKKYEVIDGSKPSDLGLAQFKDVIYQLESLRNTMLE